jgi:beta-galactosidase
MTLIVSNPGWQFVGGGKFFERTYQNVREIVRWQRNNPCILIWEPILNESGMTFEMQQEFHNIVHEEYPYSDCYTASDFGPTDVTYQDFMANMVGFEGYGNSEKRKNTPIWTREYGDAPDNWHDHNTVWRVPRGFGDFPQVESVRRLLADYQNSENAEVRNYAELRNMKNRCGYGIWPGISHNRGYHMNPCYGGHLDMFRVPKFSYYFMKSQQDRSVIGDVLFIANWWCDVSPDDVMVISNAERVELIVDGESMGIQSPDELKFPVDHPPFTFKGARRNYKKRFNYNDVRSELVARAYVGDTVVAETKVKTPGVPKSLRLEADLMGMPLYADGSDIVAVRCHLCDVDGQTNPFAGDGHPVYFEVEGEGEIIGDINILANPIFPEAGIATVLVRTTQKAGEIKIKARLFFDSFTDGSHTETAVKPATLTINSVEA